jgi:hypothetical protein
MWNDVTTFAHYFELHINLKLFPESDIIIICS